MQFFGRTIAGEQVSVQGSIAIQFANYAGS